MENFKSALMHYFQIALQIVKCVNHCKLCILNYSQEGCFW